MTTQIQTLQSFPMISIVIPIINSDDDDADGDGTPGFDTDGTTFSAMMTLIQTLQSFPMISIVILLST